ncbi:hypothetical protein KYLE_22 [Pantoea phage Kyle]|uniref:Uncharacterized protein n=1 Tax=Pantoea phage Kyle TaxID=2589665 RepID=A0A514A8U3_9CAUD|nr:hypothetical protein HWC52_gp022 [Pantoea phage Kyle]QDH49687.1 hypothetical protein KYLE_22 [Pantoea phage Kyle]
MTRESSTDAVISIGGIGAGPVRILPNHKGWLMPNKGLFPGWMIIQTSQKNGGAVAKLSTKPLAADNWLCFESYQ